MLSVRVNKWTYKHPITNSIGGRINNVDAIISMFDFARREKLYRT